MSESDDLARRTKELEIEGRRFKRVLSSLDVGDYLVILALILIILIGMIRWNVSHTPNVFSSVASGAQ